MPQSQFPVFCYFWFQKSYRKVTQEIFSELDETKAETPIFPGSIQNTEGSQEGAQGLATPPHGAARPWPRQGQVWWPWPLTDSALSPLNSLATENPSTLGNFPLKV